ncbi:MAG TPA: cation-translocating P-type ATPase [Roseiflexaceae bacterium]|nr:cation-translocating P-type ATPase [Roseiflexaceae bacterium]
MAEQTFSISGMDCLDCARTVERGVQQLDSIRACSVDLGAATLRVRYQGAPDDAAVVARVHALGYGVEQPDRAVAGPRGGSVASFMAFLLSRRATGGPLLVGGICLLGGLLLGWAGMPTSAAAAEMIALLVAGLPVALAGLRALRISRRVTINMLMTIAAVGAVVIGETAEAATVVVLFALGEALEGFTMQRSRDALRSLMRLAPAEATVLVPCMDCQGHLGKDGYTGGPCPWCGTHPEQMPVQDVQVGQIVLVKPGERVPLDGAISSGASMINQQHITGESLPVERRAGDAVYAGSINGDGALEITVSSPASESLLSRIATLVTQAQTRRAPIEHFVDRFATIYTPAVVVLALLVAAVPPLLFGQPFWDSAAEHGWLYRALALLVVACPCALVISTPVSIVSALSVASRNGVLIKGGAALEALRRVRVVAFDKTGTLTSGQLRVTEVRCADNCCLDEAACAHCDDVLALAAAVEQRSAHPLAMAVVQEAVDRHLAGRYGAEAVVALPGRGVQGQIGGRTVTIGSHAFFDDEHPHEAGLCTQVARAEASGQTTLLVCNCDDGGVQGFIALADTPRATSRQAVAALRDAGIARTAILTGDNAAVGSAVAEAVGADEVRAALLPADKLQAVHELHARYGPVAMVGDGVNDTPSLAAATVGIAMGAAGSAQALETADIALMSDDLAQLSWLLRLSQRTARVLRQNITLSLALKLAFVVLAMGGWATLWAAVLADTGAALLVTLNGMRLLREHRQ